MADEAQAVSDYWDVLWMFVFIVGVAIAVGILRYRGFHGERYLSADAPGDDEIRKIAATLDLGFVVADLPESDMRPADLIEELRRLLMLLAINKGDRFPLSPIMLDVWKLLVRHNGRYNDISRMLLGRGGSFNRESLPADMLEALPDMISRFNLGYGAEFGASPDPSVWPTDSAIYFNTGKDVTLISAVDSQTKLVTQKDGEYVRQDLGGATTN